MKEHLILVDSFRVKRTTENISMMLFRHVQCLFGGICTFLPNILQFMDHGLQVGDVLLEVLILHWSGHISPTWRRPTRPSGDASQIKGKKNLYNHHFNKEM